MPAFRSLSVSWPRQLIYNNILLGLCSLGIAVLSLILMVILFEGQQDGETLYANCIGLIILGLTLTAMAVLGIYGGWHISLQSVLVYFWGCVVAASPMIVFSVAAFDFLDYLKSWLKHHWVDSSFRFIREAFCEPGTANAECMAPVNGGLDYTSVDEWCEAKFNSTACAEIAEEAQDDAFSFTGRMLRLQGSVGILNVIQLFYAMAVCSFILTKTVIMETMNDVINYLLLIPVAGCLLMGGFLYDHKEYGVQYGWVPDYFIALGCVQCIIIPLGIYAGRMKNRNFLALYEVATFLTIACQVALSVICYTYAVALKNTFLPSAEQAQDIACHVGLAGCCCCSASDEVLARKDGRCSEWEPDEVVGYLAVELKLGGLTAILSVLYVVGGLVTADILRKNLRDYKCAYV